MILRQISTGKFIYISLKEQKKYGFKKVCRALDRIRQGTELSMYFLTLSLSGDNLDKLNKDLKKFIDFMSKRFHRKSQVFFYAWVVEVQKKRFWKYGQIARHWHFIILCSYPSGGGGALPDVEFRQDKKPHYKILEDGICISQKELYQGWGYGQILCQKAWSNDIEKYLRKYLDKQGAENLGTLRRFGSSRFGYYSYPKWAFDEIMRLSKIYPDVVVLRKGAQMDIIGLIDGGNSTGVLRCRSGYEFIWY
jgi:hypothetical protein